MKIQSSSHYDVIIIGTGIAGLHTALNLDPSLKVLTITKSKFENCNTLRAEGGMACPILPDDSPDLHTKDTLRAGGDLNNIQAVNILTNEVVDRIIDLEKIGFEFDRNLDGSLILGLEGFHSKRRILHSYSDRIGVSIFNFLSRKSMEKENFQFMEDTNLKQIILNSDGQYAGVLLQNSEGFSYITSSYLVLASGGFSNIFARSTSDSTIFGDVLAIGFTAGLALEDMEFIQFHPTTFIKAGFEPFLLSEALRGEGAILLNKKLERFMSRYHPDLELASRDIVSRSIFLESLIQGDETFYLDLRPIGKDKILHLFPGIVENCKIRGIDVTVDLAPIFPAAHYTMGGIKTDLSGKTNIDNIFAVGEVSCNGVHGANRLASNSLIEALVFSKRAADNMNAFTHLRNPSSAEIQIHEEDNQISQNEIQEQMKEIRLSNWKNLGVIRTGTKMISYLKTLEKRFQSIMEKTNANKLLYSHESLWLLSYLVCLSALNRKESRGAHFREDYPEKNRSMQYSQILQWKENQLQITNGKRGKL